MLFPLLSLLVLSPSRGQACEAQVQQLRQEMNEQYVQMEARLLQKDAEIADQVADVAEELPRAPYSL